MLGFFGFTDIHSVVIEPSLAAPDDVAGTVATAIKEAELIATSM